MNDRTIDPPQVRIGSGGEIPEVKHNAQKERHNFYVETFN